MLLRDLSGFLNGVECISEYKLSPFLLYGFLSVSYTHLEKIYFGKATRADITRVTKRLGDEIAAVYGFHIPKQRTAREQAR